MLRRECGMDCDPLAWIVVRPVVDADLGDIDVSQPSGYVARYADRHRGGRDRHAELATFKEIVAQFGDLAGSVDVAHEAAQQAG
jgi:hypothetical protein